MERCIRNNGMIITEFALKDRQLIVNFGRTYGPICEFKVKVKSTNI